MKVPRTAAEDWQTGGTFIVQARRKPVATQNDIVAIRRVLCREN